MGREGQDHAFEFQDTDAPARQRSIQRVVLLSKRVFVMRPSSSLIALSVLICATVYSHGQEVVFTETTVANFRHSDNFISIYPMEHNATRPPSQWQFRFLPALTPRV